MGNGASIPDDSSSHSDDEGLAAFSSKRGRERNGKVPYSNLKNNHDEDKLPYLTIADAEKTKKRMIKQGKDRADNLVVYRNTELKRYYLGNPNQSCSEEKDTGGSGFVLLAAGVVAAAFLLASQNNDDEKSKSPSKGGRTAN